MATEAFSLTGRIDSMLKDLEPIHDLAKSVSAPMPVTSVVAELNRKLVADGLGDRDNSELVRLFRPAR